MKISDLARQPLGGALAVAAFLLPILAIYAFLGALGAIGALCYLGVLFMVGEVTVKWVPFKNRRKGKELGVSWYVTPKKTPEAAMEPKPEACTDDDQHFYAHLVNEACPACKAIPEAI